MDSLLEKVITIGVPISAKEARAIKKQLNVINKQPTEFEQIMEDIKAILRNSDSNCLNTKILSRETIDHLKNLGYTITYNDDPIRSGCDSITIDWE